MKSGIFKLYTSDFVRGLITAIFSAVIIALYAIVTVGDFSFFNVNWNVVGKQMTDVAGVTFVSYVFKNLLSDKKGAVLGIIGGEKSDEK